MNEDPIDDRSSSDGTGGGDPAGKLMFCILKKENFTSPESCRGCRYHRRLTRFMQFRVCLYCYDTGQPRGCDASGCDKREEAEEQPLGEEQEK